MKLSLRFDNLTTTNWANAGGLGCAVTSVLVFFFGLYLPMQDAQLDQQFRIEQLTKLISESRAANIQSSSLKRELELLTKHVASIRRRIPSTSNEAEMLQQLTTVAADSDFTVSDYRRGVIQQVGIHARFEIGITGRGNYSSICSFLDGVFRLERVNRIERLEIRTADENDEYSVNVTISVFYGGSVATPS